MSKRKKRNEIHLTDKEMLKPIDIELFGSEDDPCFGKLYKLSTPECKRCGDSEICATVMGQRLNVKRKGIEENNRFKDIELEEESADDYCKRLYHKLGKIKIRRRLIKKYTLTRAQANKVIRKNDN